MRERLSQFLNKEAIVWIYVGAFLVIFSLFASVVMSSWANLHKSISEEDGNNWLFNYQEYLDNRANVDAKNRAENYRISSTDNAVKSFNLDLKAGLYRMSAELSILSVMFFLVGLSVSKGKGRVATNVFGFWVLFTAFFVFFYASWI